MYKCLKCGHLFEEGEQRKITESYGEEMYGCPLCGEPYEETLQCKICGSEHLEKELIGEVCEECIDEYKKDIDVCYKIGKNDFDSINLNCFLSTMFTVEEIEQILLEKLKKEKADCSEFVDADIYWFAERLAEEVNN